MNKCIILEVIGERVNPILYDYDGPAKVYTNEEAAVEILSLQKEDPRASYQIVSFTPMTKNCVILEIRPSTGQVLFAEVDTSDGEEGVSKLFTEIDAARELDRLRKYRPTFKFQVVKFD